MNMHQYLHALLLTIDGVQSVSWGFNNSDSSYPSMVLQQISKVNAHHFSGVNDMADYRIQLNIWAKTYGEVVTLSNAVDALLNDRQDATIKYCVRENQTDLIEATPPDVLYGRRFDLLIKSPQ